MSQHTKPYPSQFHVYRFIPFKQMRPCAFQSQNRAVNRSLSQNKVLLRRIQYQSERTRKDDRSGIARGLVFFFHFLLPFLPVTEWQAFICEGIKKRKKSTLIFLFLF
jgi:hypothetical protein